LILGDILLPFFKKHPFDIEALDEYLKESSMETVFTKEVRSCWVVIFRSLEEARFDDRFDRNVHFMGMEMHIFVDWGRSLKFPTENSVRYLKNAEETKELDGRNSSMFIWKQ